MKVKLKDIGKVITGRTPPTQDKLYWNSNDVPFVKPDDFKNDVATLDKYNTYISFDGLRKANKIPSYSVLVTCIGTIGKVVVTNRELATNQQINAIVPNDKVDARYLMYQILEKRAYLNHIANAPVVPIINKTNFENIEINLPSLSKQKEIAQTLDKVSELIELRKASIQKLDELAQSIFIDMFGDPVTNPKGWEVKQLQDISTHILNGNTPQGGSKVYVDEGILFIRSQNVWKNRIEHDDIAYIDQKIHSKMKKSSLKHKDILITKTGRVNTENSSLGRAALFLGEDDSANINGHVYLVRLQKSMAHEYIVHILTTKEYREYIRRICVGAIDKRQINKNHLEEFPIIFPPIEMQMKFAEQVKIINSQKALYESELTKLQAAFDALMAESF